MLSHKKDVAEIARYRGMLKQSLHIYGVSVSPDVPNNHLTTSSAPKQHLNSGIPAAARGPDPTATDRDGS
jgi:hypothetical protein